MVRKLTKDTGVGSVSESTLIFAFQLFLLVFAFGKLSENALGSVESKLFAEFLNRWWHYKNSFEESFPRFDGSKGMEKLVVLRNKLLLYYVTAPYLIFVSVLVLGFQGGSPLTYIYMIHLSVSLVEDVKVMMSFEVIAVCFANLREAISLERYRVKDLTVGNVRKWRSLVLFLRDQVTAAGNYQKVHQLCVMICTVFSVTTLVFVLLNGKFNSAHGSALRLVMSFVALVHVIRVYRKILAAERITNEVRPSLIFAC